MKLKYYGTAAAEGWPGLFCTCPVCVEARKRGGKDLRTRSQSAVDDRLLIDFPPDTYLHMLFYGLDLPNFHSCIVTHAHEDHLYEKDVFMRRNGFCEKVNDGGFTLYGSKNVVETLNAEPERKRDPERMDWKLVEPFVPFETEGYTVTPLKALHDRSMDCYLYIIEKDGKRLFYGNDTGFFPEETWAYIKGIHFDLVSLDCTCLLLKEGTNHMGIEDVLEVQAKMKAIGCADDTTKWVINHFSHNGGILHDELVEKMKPYGFDVAYDGMEVEF